MLRVPNLFGLNTTRAGFCRVHDAGRMQNRWVVDGFYPISVGSHSRAADVPAEGVGCEWFTSHTLMIGVHRPILPKSTEFPISLNYTSSNILSKYNCILYTTYLNR